MSGNENTSTATSGVTVNSKTAGDTISADTFQQMLSILDNLTDHTHIFYDDYSTACNCNCACACGRGSC
jgi:hypothetical protein